MAPLNNIGDGYITPDISNTFAHHCDKVYTVSRAPNYHHLLKFYVPVARGYIISGTYHLDPSHWMLPVVSKQGKTVPAVDNLTVAFRVGTQEGRYTKGGPLPMVNPIQQVMPSSIPLAKLGRAVTASTWQQTLRKYARQLIQGAG